MAELSNSRRTQRIPCSLAADCISLEGEPNLYRVNIRNYNKGGICIVSKKCMNIGAHEIIRVHALSGDNHIHVLDDLRIVSVAVTIWTKEITKKKGIEFRSGMKYLFVP